MEYTDELEKATLEARKEGVYAGLSSGLASAVLGSKLMGFGRNKTIVCGVLTGVLSGYLFTQAFIDTRRSATIREARAHRAALAAAEPPAVPS